MTAFVTYKTARTVRSYVVDSPKSMWEAINKVLNKGYTVTEVVICDSGISSIYTLHFDLQGEPILRKFR